MNLLLRLAAGQNPLHAPQKRTDLRVRDLEKDEASCGPDYRMSVRLNSG